MATTPTLRSAVSARASGKQASARASRRPAAPALVDSAIPARLRIACGVLLAAHVGLFARLYWLQVHRHEQFVRQANAQRRKTRLFPARRGGILDRNRTYLVSTQPAYNLVLDPNEWYVAAHPSLAEETPEGRQQRAVAGLRTVLPQIDFDRFLKEHPIVKRAGSDRYQPLDIARVDRDQAAAIRKLCLPGVGLLDASRRVAANGHLAAHIVGFVNAEGVGVDGLESKLDGQLRGVEGLRSAEYVHNRPIPGTFKIDRPGVDGRDVVLTVDAEIQHRTELALARACGKYRAESGTAIVLDPSNGDVLAMANWPTYNVNEPGKSPSGSRFNRAVSFVFEPGSTLKVMTVAGALETGVARLDGTYDCSGKMAIGRRTIHCAHPHEKGHGHQRLIDVIQNSCNVATAQCALALGARRLHGFERKFGFGERTGICLPAESPGILTDPRRRPWPDIKTANVGFGQGISVTPLQLAAAYATFVDGIYRPPRLVKGWIDSLDGSFSEQPSDRGHAVIAPATAAEVRKMLSAVVERGTGTKAQLDGYSAGGKTGTAQIAERGGYHERYVASFVGLAPIEKPRFVILVAIRDPKGEHYGGVVAAPVFREIAQQALYLNRVPPDRPRRGPVRPEKKPEKKKEDRARFAEA